MKNLKRTIALLLCALMLLPLFGAGAFAAGEEDGEEPLFGEVYEYIADAIGNGVPVLNGNGVYEIPIDVSSFGISVEEMRKICLSVYYQNPQLFFWDGRYSYGYSDGIVLNIYPIVTIAPEDMEEARAQFEGMLDALCALCPPDATPLETVLFYHDHLAANYEYDRTYTVSDAYTFMQQKKGVCQAYTALFLLLMDRFGIPCTYACSDTINHIWNLVKLDGAWYHLDVTYDDPIIDRPGKAQHVWFLTGSASTTQIDNGKKNVDDIVWDANVTVSVEDHPLRAMLSGSDVPVVAVEGEFYSVLGDEDQTNLVRFLSDLTDYRNLRDLPVYWRIPGDASGRKYVGCYSSVASDGKYLYFFDDSTVYAYDPFTDDEITVWDCPADAAVYGLQYADGQLIAHTSTGPGALPYTARTIDQPLPEPVYYTLTWIVGGQEYKSVAREGTDPLDSFNGSTEFEGEAGVEYFFSGWDPLPEEVSGDATYTAVFTVRYAYLPGDTDDNGMLDIEDVTALLDLLASGAAMPPAADVNGNGAVDIDDVTALLDLLAAAGSE